MAFQGDSIYWVEVGKIVPNPFQPRREFSEDKLKELSESIRMYGILQPLTVTRNEIQSDDGAFYTEYELIAGERRLRASKLAGLEQVPVIIRSGEDTEQEKLELAIIENLQREDLNAVDRALAFKQLAEVFKLSHAQVGKKIGRSREYVSNSIRLLALPDCILNSLSLGDISEGHARTLLMLRERPEEQDVVYREILLKKLSVREVERIARKIATDKVRVKKWTNTDAHLIEIEREFTNTLGTRVQIAKTDFGGKLTIDYFSDDDLQKLLSLMQHQENTLKGENNAHKEADGGDDDAESQTVIQEMSPEASLMAKLAVSTPLEVVDNVVESVPVPIPVDTEIPIITQYEPSPVVEEVPEINEHSDTKPPSVATATGYLRSQGFENETVIAPKVDPVILPASTNEASLDSDDEFAFIHKKVTDSSEDGVVKNKSERHAVSEDAPSSILKNIEPEVDPAQVLAESAVEALTEAVTDKEIPVEPIKKDDDEDLYSMKNFSL